MWIFCCSLLNFDFSGAHSLGFCHCLFFIDRLYDFKGTGLPDPDMDLSILDALRKKCPKPVSTISSISSDPKAFINQASTTPFHLDNSFYHGVLNGEAVLQLDQELAFTSLTNDLVVRYANSPRFFILQFSKAMIKLGNVGVLTGEEGEIRRNCRRVNNKNHWYTWTVKFIYGYWFSVQQINIRNGGLLVWSFPRGEVCFYFPK